jgi:uncharacterized protein (DUF2062 family)
MRVLWELAKNEHASPRQIAYAVGLGVFCGCTPGVGFHAAIGAFAATIFRLNRLWAIIGSRISNMLILPWIVLAEIQLAHRIRTGEWAVITLDNAMDTAGEMLLDWCIGSVPVGLALGLVFGALAYVIARWRANVRAERERNAPAEGAAPEGHAPSSDSPAPPAT